MRSYRLLAGSIRIRSRLTQWAHLTVLIALGVLLGLQAHGGFRFPGMRQGSSANQGVQVHIDEISSGIASYIQNHDSASLEKIKGEGKEATRVTAELRKQLVDSGKDGAAARIEQDYQGVRQATVDLLAADQAAVQAGQAFNEAKDSLAGVLDQMLTAIKPNQLNASSRLRAVRIAQSEARNLSRNGSRFNRAVNTYQELSRTRRAERWSDQAGTLFRQCVSFTNDLQQAEEKRQAARDRFEEKKKALAKSLAEAPVPNPQGKTSGPLSTVSGALVVLGIILVMRSSWHSEKGFARPLHDILRCVEAAAAGDTSRVPEHWSTDEVGQLSQAVGRLISVLARSENLVYHLAALVESSGDAIISQTLDGKILSWNKGAQRIYGYSAEEVKGQSIDILSPQDNGAQMLQQLRRVRNGERLQPFETVHQARNGRHIPVLVRVAAIQDSTKQIIGASFIAQDLSGADLLKSKSTEKSKAA